jgi:glycosyltransferase involved in cell wall biosynthesis
VKVLFVHNNFPAQFASLATALARRDDTDLAAIGCETARPFPGVRLHRYRAPRSLAQAHSFARRFDNEARRAEDVMYTATKMVADGFTPDIVFVHPGWGESLPLRALFPTARIVVYCEYYYRREGGDIGFDPEFPAMGIDGYVALDARNAATLLALASCDAAVAPTPWQKSTYPAIFQPLIEVAHEGIDTDYFAPDPDAAVRLPDGAVPRAGDEIVTYAARNLEPVRGFHCFMRALPGVLERRPNARALIVGEAGVSYGAPPRKFANWKEAMLAELGDALDLSRVTFLPKQSYSEYLKILQISAAHVYLTYPFVLSWSMLEAMSVGCVLIASDTAPVRDAADATNAILTPMFDIPALADRVIDALAHRAAHRGLREAARRAMVERFDSTTVCAPRLTRLVERLAAGTR